MLEAATASRKPAPRRRRKGEITAERILDAAEELFADLGFDATSTRAITTRAGVNLAAVNYHYGSKDALIEAVFARRLVPLNRERLELLDRVEARAGAGGPAVESIVEAFVRPPMRKIREVPLKASSRVISTVWL